MSEFWHGFMAGVLVVVMPSLIGLAWLLLEARDLVLQEATRRKGLPPGRAANDH